MDFDSIVANRQSLTLFRPEMMLAGASVLVLLMGAFFKMPRKLSLWIGSVVLVAYLAMSLEFLELSVPVVLFSGAIVVDGFSVFFRFFFALVSLCTLAMVARSDEVEDASLPEVVSFVLALTLSLSMMASANDLLMMLLSFEMVSVLSYIMVGFKRHSRRSSEAGLKYILYGAVASGVMFFGMSYIFGLTGSTDLRDIASYFSSLQGISAAPSVLFALLCVMIGFGFKIATFPTQMWCPDVYEGAPLPVTAFLSVGPKAAGFALIARFFITGLAVGTGKAPQVFQFINWELLLAVLAAITMTIGNLAAMPQRNLKRLMAYSSIAHAGYLLMGFSTLSVSGLEAVLFYLVTYLLMNFGAFFIILLISRETGTEEIDGYRGLAWRTPVLGILLAVFLFSLTGLPPFAGFVGKLFLFGAVIREGHYWLAVVAAVNTVISLFYYARIIRAMFLTSPLDPAPVRVPLLSTGFALVLAAFTLVLGLFWQPLMLFVERSASSLFG